MRLEPLAISELSNALQYWNLDAYPDEPDDRQTGRFLAETEAHPEARRRQVNLLIDLLNDGHLVSEDRAGYLGDALNRWFDDPQDALAWLESLVSNLVGDETEQRTTDTAGRPPSLSDLQNLWAFARKLRPTGAELPSPADTAERVVGSDGRKVGQAAGLLLRLLNSDYGDRAKADFIVAHVGPYFYSDLEAIEWAAEVARWILEGEPG